MNQRQLFWLIRIGDHLRGCLGLVSSIYHQDHLHTHVLVVTTTCSLTKAHEVRDITTMPSRDQG
jgi:hypothetical protein